MHKISKVTKMMIPLQMGILILKFKSTLEGQLLHSEAR